MEYIVSLISDLPQDCPMGNALAQDWPHWICNALILEQKGQSKEF